MDFGLIALVLFVGSKVLDYVAPKTKTKIDDKARDIVHAVIPLLPAAKEARAREAAPAPSRPAPIVTVKDVMAAARDHRK